MHDVFLIGGAPSSGSTLLVHMLNCRDSVLCLPETGLFVHAENLVETPIDAEKMHLPRRLPWVNTGHKVAQAIGLDPNAYDEEIKDYPTAFDMLRAHVDSDRTVYLIEKTPENIFAFYPYLTASSGNRVVLTTRDTVSVVQSLVRRGFTMAEALLVWFAHSYETARLIRDFAGQVYQCTYEQLTKNPTKTVIVRIDQRQVR